MDTGGVDVADLGKLGFWRLVAVVKRDRVLVEAHADQIGRIDTAAFRAGVRLRAPVWVGNLLMVLGIVLGGVAMWVAFASATPWVQGLALIARRGHLGGGRAHARALAGGPGHRDPLHGLLPGGPAAATPGLEDRLRHVPPADPDSRAWFHASGRDRHQIAPFVALAFWPASGAPWWSAAVLLVIGVGQIVTDITLSVKSSDWKKFLREKAVARAMEPAPRIDPMSRPTSAVGGP